MFSVTRVRAELLALIAVCALSAVGIWLFTFWDNVGADEGPFKVVASGLDNPRGLAFGPDGTLYVVEAGRGGEGPCIPSPEGEGAGEFCYGSTGAITRVWDGHQSKLSGAYPSLAGEDGTATGLHGISVEDNGKIYVIVGLGAHPGERAPLADEQKRVWVFGSLIKVDQDGAWEVTQDVSNFEWFHNPDGGLIDSNLYSVLALEGKQIVVDAGGNSLLEVLPDGTINTLAVFPSREVDRPAELPAESFPDKIPMESVPTSVVKGPDGAYYVGELTGFPFPQGEARVYRIVPGEEPEIYAEGFTNIIDLAFDHNGRLHVLEITAEGLLAAESAAQTGDDPMSALQGALIRVNDDGSHEEIASEGLTAPGGLAIGHDGAFYVSNCGICVGEGEVVRIEPKPAATPGPAATPTPEPTGTPAATPTPEPTGTPAATPTPEPTGTPAATPMREIEVTLTSSLEFDPNLITVSPGETVQFNLVNDSPVFHTFTIADSDQKQEIFVDQSVEADQSLSVEFTAPEQTGDLYLFCRPHEQAGMIGTIRVQ